MTTAQKERLILSILRAFPDNVFCNTDLRRGIVMQASDIVKVRLVPKKHVLTDGRVIIFFNCLSERIKLLKERIAAMNDFRFRAWSSVKCYHDDNDDLRYCAIPSWLDGAGHSTFLSYVKCLFRLLGNIEVSSIEEAELQLVLMGKLITS